MAQVSVKRGAQRLMRRLDKRTAKRLLVALQKLEDDPDRDDLNIRRLADTAGFRLRVGDWRILFDRDGDRITVQAIRRWCQTYRRRGT